MTSDRYYEFTINMRHIFNDRFCGLKTYYCREDYENAVRSYKNAKSSTRHFRYDELCLMCHARGIDPDALLADPALLEQIPSRAQTGHELMDIFYSLYKSFPRSADYMERIVRRLAPEYSDDTVRTAILKKFLSGTGPSSKTFPLKRIREWVLNTFDDARLTSFRSMTPQEQHNAVISGVTDSIFLMLNEDLSISGPDRLRIMDKCLKKCEKKETILFAGLKLRPETEQMLDTFLLESGETMSGISAAQKLHRAADLFSVRIFSKDAAERVSPLIDHLDADFGNTLKETAYINKKGSEACAFELYKNDKDNAKAKIKEELELLQICNDLASGSFRTNGAAKTNLYYFAIMFGMTLPSTGADYDPQTDLEKNLFQDYYNDDLLRVLEGDDSSVEAEPTGEGINYKNYAEVIYLYVICRNDLHLAPGEKIDLAQQLISKTKTIAKKNPDHENLLPYDTFTMAYTDYLNLLLNQSPEDVPAYVASHYHVIPQERAYGSQRSKKPILSSAAEENTAQAIILGLLSPDSPDVLSPPDEKEVFPGDPNTHNHTASDGGQTPTGQKRWIFNARLAERFPDDPAFLKIADKLNERTYGILRKAEELTRPDHRITRSEFIAVYLNFYLQRIFERIPDPDESFAEGEEPPEPLPSTFPELLEEFDHTLSALLAAARYQPLSEKNLFDVYIICVLYFYLLSNGAYVPV